MNEIRTVDLIFRPEVVDKFDSYARRKGYAVKWSGCPPYQTATVVFQTATLKRNFMSGWANESLST